MEKLKKLAVLLLAGVMVLSFAGAAFADEEDDEEELIIPEVISVTQEYEGKTIVLKTANLDIIEADGLSFKDFNKDGELQPYEDWRLSAEERTDDLLSRMDITQVGAQMAHMTLRNLKESVFSEFDIGFALTYSYFGESKEYAAHNMNYIQALCEESELAIPVVFSMDSVIGASWINGTTILPDAITLAATGDAELVNELADIQRQEMKALGVRVSLSPNADIATDPRWGRNQETYGEDVDTAKAMVTAAVTGLQAGTEGINEESVIACVKHFPGSGPQTAGVDGTPLVFDDETFPLHLSIFEAALSVNPGMIMPYGYSTVPYLGGDAVDNYAHESTVVMTDLLRNQLGYEGIIQTDWGLNHIVAMQAGADVMGGMSQRDVTKMIEAENEDTLKEHCRRLLIAKFKLGVFENPFVDAEEVAAVVGTEENYAKAMEAAEKAVTLVKYENQQPLEGQNIIVAGALAENAEALNSGWKLSEEDGLNVEGKSILEAITNRAGNVTYIGEDVNAVEESYPEGTTAIVIVGEPDCTHQPSWGEGNLEFPSEQVEMLKALRSAGANVVSVVLMGRPYVMTPVAENSDAVMIVYRPGVTAGAEAVAHALFGDCAISGKLPWQLPATMEQVLLQREDMPKDIENPMYDYGYGIDVAAFGK
ncbi:MAG: glycoside hydrolase family 3 C-terminal domain-containing protein [Parasporobacterium sp.]|nr:glycoside hydrolase family 3 C-terminal domain-containing protein [Parasporobacterium sp.]